MEGCTISILAKSDEQFKTYNYVKKGIKSSNKFQMINVITNQADFDFDPNPDPILALDLDLELN